MVVSTTLGLVPTLITLGCISVRFSVGCPSITSPVNSFTILGVEVIILPTVPFSTVSLSPTSIVGSSTYVVSIGIGVSVSTGGRLFSYFCL